MGSRSMSLKVTYPTIAKAQEAYRAQLRKQRLFVPGGTGTASDVVTVSLRIEETGGVLELRARVVKELDASTARKHGLGKKGGVVVSIPLTDEIKAPLKELLTGSLRGKTLQDEVTDWLEGIEEKTHYEVLDVSSSASPDDIRSAYLALMKRFHPDNYFGRASDETIDQLELAYQAVASAFQVLADGKKRDEYDIAIGNFTDSEGGSSANVKRERARLQEYRQSNKAGIRKARDLWQAALEDEKAGNIKAARSKIKLAMNFDPMNPAFERKLKELKG